MTDDVFCTHEGCGQRIVSSSDGTTWFHWLNDDGVVTPTQHSSRGGSHYATPPDDVREARLRPRSPGPLDWDEWRKAKANSPTTPS